MEKIKMITDQMVRLQERLEGDRLELIDLALELVEALNEAKEERGITPAEA